MTAYDRQMEELVRRIEALEKTCTQLTGLRHGPESEPVTPQLTEEQWLALRPLAVELKATTPLEYAHGYGQLWMKGTDVEALVSAANFAAQLLRIPGCSFEERNQAVVMLEQATKPFEQVAK